MQSSHQISAVIPTYNRERTLAMAIDSVLAQEFPASEVVVVDDGSNDNTANIIDQYGAKVRYVYQENAGISAARNRCVSEAGYEWIAFLDSDDYWLPHHLKNITNAIDATQGKAALYFADTKRPKEEGGGLYWGICGFSIKGNHEVRRDGGDWVLMDIQPMMLQSSVIRRARYFEVGGLPGDLRTREDTLLFLKLGLLYPICAVAGCGAVMTAQGNMRLSQDLGSASLSFWNATLSVYKEVLAIGNRITPERRKYLEDKLSAAYFSIGRIFFRQKKYLKSTKNLSISSFISPSRFARDFFDSLGRRVIKKQGRAPNCA
jgi:glycosyltransferase involved in cell wall biosynthesis